MYSASITFEITCIVRSNKHGGMKIEKMTPKFLTAIGESFRQNGRLNSNEEFFSSDLGIIVLHNYKIKLIKSTAENSSPENNSPANRSQANGASNGLKIEFNVTTQNPISSDIKDIAEIIWTIMPACYAEDESYRFRINMDIDYQNNCRTNMDYQNTYWLDIADVPQNITYVI